MHCVLGPLLTFTIFTAACVLLFRTFYFFFCYKVQIFDSFNPHATDICTLLSHMRLMFSTLFLICKSGFTFRVLVLIAPAVIFSILFTSRKYMLFSQYLEVVPCVQLELKYYVEYPIPA